MRMLLKILLIMAAVLLSRNDAVSSGQTVQLLGQSSLNSFSGKIYVQMQRQNAAAKTEIDESQSFKILINGKILYFVSAQTNEDGWYSVPSTCAAFLFDKDEALVSKVSLVGYEVEARPLSIQVANAPARAVAKTSAGVR
ncbi:hypothetical protein GMSM_46450 [Geomonas sp. Red276]